MQKIILAVIATLVCGSYGHCQLKKFYSIKNESTFDTVDFLLKATSGTYFIKPSHDPDPLSIYGNPSFADVNPTFYSNTHGKTNHVMLDLQDYNQKGLSHTITYSMFAANEKEEKNFWKIYLNDEKVYRLKLLYGVGNAYVNLSSLPVSNFKIITGSADVNVRYDEQMANQCPMDTFYVKVDFGTVWVRKIQLSRARHVIAEVGFGTAVLDFSEAMSEECFVNATVGAGNLKILLPKNDFPAIVYFKGSPLCNISLAGGFEEVDQDTYVNASYTPDAKNLLEFNIDVALGNITFEYTK